VKMPLNLSQEHIPQDAIVAFLCQQLYPKEQDPIRKKRVRARINDARKRGELSKATIRKGKHYVHGRTFFEWAFSKKGWEVLDTIPDIPRNATVKAIGVEARVETGRAFAFGFPVDMDELIEAYKDKQEMEREIKKLREKLQKKEDRSKRATEDGKLGGRSITHSE
tara:strand:+ start:876 stop:1373 length:498 start_codon:yes stop_codon:yes gene_type:complete